MRERNSMQRSIPFTWKAVQEDPKAIICKRLNNMSMVMIVLKVTGSRLPENE